VTTPVLQEELHVARCGVASLLHLPLSRRIAAGCDDGSIRLLVMDSEMAGTSLPAASGSGSGLAYSSSGSGWVPVRGSGSSSGGGGSSGSSGSSSGMSRADGNQKAGNSVAPPAVAVLSGHEGRVTGLAALPGGLLLSAGEDCTLRLWDTATLKQLHVSAAHAHVDTHTSDT
jgi:WD40 repeat protein